MWVRVFERPTLSNSGSHESSVNERTLEQWTPKLLKETRWKEKNIKNKRTVAAYLTTRCNLLLHFYHSKLPGVPLPVDPWALDAEQDSQVDGSPAGSRLSTVTAQIIAWQALHSLEKVFPSSPTSPLRLVPPLSELAGRVDAAGGGRGSSV